MPRAPWRPSTNIWCGATKNSHAVSRRPSTIPSHDPGYIKGYPAGIRENGGQYTHGAVWAALAFAMQGDGDRAGELLSMLNPIHHADSPTGVHRYKVEPYVVCADIYSDAAACRARWMDLVHRIGRMDVSRGAGMASRLSAARRKSGARSLHPARLAGFRDLVPLSLRAL